MTTNLKTLAERFDEYARRADQEAHRAAGSPRWCSHHVGMAQAFRKAAAELRDAIGA